MGQSCRCPARGSAIRSEGAGVKWLGRANPFGAALGTEQLALAHTPTWGEEILLCWFPTGFQVARSRWDSAVCQPQKPRKPGSEGQLEKLLVDTGLRQALHGTLQRRAVETGPERWHRRTLCHEAHPERRQSASFESGLAQFLPQWPWVPVKMEERGQDLPPKLWGLVCCSGVGQGQLSAGAPAGRQQPEGVAFLVALNQNKQLIGDRGLLPCRAYLESVREYFRGSVGWDAVSYAPTVLWLLDWSDMNTSLDLLALLGLGISSFILATGCANMALMAALWVLYMSLVNVGQVCCARTKVVATLHKRMDALLWARPPPKGCSRPEAGAPACLVAPQPAVWSGVGVLPITDTAAVGQQVEVVIPVARDRRPCVPSHCTPSVSGGGDRHGYPEGGASTSGQLWTGTAPVDRQAPLGSAVEQTAAMHTVLRCPVRSRWDGSLCLAAQCGLAGTGPHEQAEHSPREPADLRWHLVTTVPVREAQPVPSSPPVCCHDNARFTHLTAGSRTCSQYCRVHLVADPDEAVGHRVSVAQGLPVAVGAREGAPPCRKASESRTKGEPHFYSAGAWHAASPSDVLAGDISVPGLSELHLRAPRKPEAGLSLAGDVSVPGLSELHLRAPRKPEAGLSLAGTASAMQRAGKGQTRLVGPESRLSLAGDVSVPGLSELHLRAPRKPEAGLSLAGDVSVPGLSELHLRAPRKPEAGLSLAGDVSVPGLSELHLRAPRKPEAGLSLAGDVSVPGLSELHLRAPRKPEAGLSLAGDVSVPGLSELHLRAPRKPEAGLSLAGDVSVPGLSELHLRAPRKPEAGLSLEGDVSVPGLSELHLRAPRKPEAGLSLAVSRPQLLPRVWAVLVLHPTRGNAQVAVQQEIDLWLPDRPWAPRQCHCPQDQPLMALSSQTLTAEHGMPTTCALNLPSLQPGPSGLAPALSTRTPGCMLWCRPHQGDPPTGYGKSPQGLIKIRGDRCWRDLTCMDFHYETQPVPSPAAYYLHRSPWWLHRCETLGTHLLELLVPFLVFLGRRACVIHGLLQILFQVVLIVSGNLSFLNWLTMVPCLACFDDAALGRLLPSTPGGLKDRVHTIQEEEACGVRPAPRRGPAVRRVVNLALGVLVAWLSVPVVLNLLSSKQVMNTSFSPLRIVNTYGAFGSITRERTEVILQGTTSPNASAPDAVWEDYEFKCKPGDPRRRPCLITPYHYRLDWLMWFAAFQLALGRAIREPSHVAPGPCRGHASTGLGASVSEASRRERRASEGQGHTGLGQPHPPEHPPSPQTYEHNEWIIHLAGKLLANDADALSLLALNPFAGRPPPRWVRGEHYRYKFSRPGGQRAAEGQWWVRKRIGPYFPPLSLEDLRTYFRSRGWPLPEPV
ncbi:Lipase maturation factor 1 [Tupaia chinensis]|uniref:Lipase maturation factor n=1 Tax=Tupaia chinensis TaxID=246437 RepID=L9KXV2_TUPCH|nr:Lipase maturation factor 1 [Tupaia chinensis]